MIINNVERLFTRNIIDTFFGNCYSTVRKFFPNYFKNIQKLFYHQRVIQVKYPLYSARFIMEQPRHVQINVSSLSSKIG
jgi:hypothetical protein